MGSKRKLRLILEYLGYKRIKTNKTGLTLYSMVKTDPFSMVPLRVNEKAAWTVLYELSDELDDFIDYVYPLSKKPQIYN